MPCKAARRVSYTFPTLKLNGCPLDVVNSYRYLGHVISCVTDDNTDILRHLSLLYARTNVLLRKFTKCSQAVTDCVCITIDIVFSESEPSQCDTYVH